MSISSKSKISKIRIILPPGDKRPAEILCLEDLTPKTLHEALDDHFIEAENIPNYTDLYAVDDGSLDRTTVQSFLDERGRQPIKPAAAFHGRKDFKSIIQQVMADARAKLRKPDAKFTLLQEDERHPHGDCTKDDLTKEALQVQADVSLFLLEHGKTIGKDKVVVSRADAKEWVENQLGPDLEIIAREAAEHDVIFHEPHHGLTPGMLLLDELFKRMVKEVRDMIVEINKQPKRKKPDGTLEPNLAALEEFVTGLAVTGKGRDSEKYGVYINKAGDFGCPHLPNSSPAFHVDPSRIELFVDDNGNIRRASLIIGSWKGGTHSSGHTGG